MEVAKKDIKSSPHKKSNFVITRGEGCERGVPFTIYINIKSLLCTPETNIMLYADYTSTYKKEKESEKAKR